MCEHSELSSALMTVFCRAEVFLRINVCYECKCIFFHIFYAIVTFMKCCGFALYVSCLHHCAQKENAECASCTACIISVMLLLHQTL